MWSGPISAFALRDQEVARLVQRRLAPVDEERRVDHRLRVELARQSGCSSRRALMWTPGFSHSRCTIGSADAVVVQIDVGVAHRFLGGRDALGAVERPAARAPHDDALERSRTARIASRCETRLRARAEDRERARRSRARAAASRRRRRRRCGSAVIAARVHERARLAGVAVEERHEALVRVEPARAVAGHDRQRLQRPHGASPPRCAGIRPIRLGSFGGRKTGRSGL